MRNAAYPLRKEHAKTYINRLLRQGYMFEVAPHVRYVEVTVNQDSEAPRKEWLFDMAENLIQNGGRLRDGRR